MSLRREKRHRREEGINEGFSILIHGIRDVIQDSLFYVKDNLMTPYFIYILILHL